MELPAKKKPVKPNKDNKCPTMQNLDTGIRIDIDRCQKSMLRMRTTRGEFKNSKMFNSMADSQFEKKKSSGLIGISTTGQNNSPTRRPAIVMEKNFSRQSRFHKCDPVSEVNAAS